MKKFLILICLMSCSLMVATAQEDKKLEEAKAVIGEGSIDFLDQATEGKFSSLAIRGKWTFSGPGVKLVADSWAARLAGEFIEKTVRDQLSQMYTKVGLTPGMGLLELKRNGSFEATLKDQKVKGKYTYDALQHKISFTVVTKKKEYPTVSGSAYFEGKELLIVFPIGPLMDIVSKLETTDSKLASAAKLLKEYEDLEVGVALKRP